MNITRILFDQVERRPDALAIRHPAGDLNYGEFGARVASAANGLADAGVAAKEVVAIRLDDPLDHWTATLALAHTGATVVSIPRSMPDGQRERLMNLTQCTRVLAGNEYLSGQETSHPSVIHWSDIQARSEGCLFQPAVVDPDQPWLYVSGSGSTGRPKILPLTHRQELARRVATMGSLPYDAQEVLHSLVGVHFSSAKHRYFEAISAGAAISLGKPGLTDLRDEVDQCRITVIHGTVFHVEKILSTLPSDEELVYPKLKALMLGGSTVSMSLRRRIKERLTPHLFVRWGTNESGAATVSRGESVFSVNGCVGYPLPGFTIEIVDQTGAVLPPGSDGLIRVSSSTLIDGYLGDPGATHKAFRHGWFYPGDIGHLTPDGQLVHRGRADDMMIVSGVNVYPAEVRECLLGFPGVADALVTPVRHSWLQDLPVALVVAAPDATLDARALLQHVHSQIGRHTLHDLVFVERIPRNGQGKVQGEAIAGILRSRWARQQAVARPAATPENAIPAPKDTVTLQFEVPKAAVPGALKPWLALLDEQLLHAGTAATARASAGSGIDGAAWLHDVLTLTQGLLHVLRAPVFDPVELIQCRRADPASDRWQALCRLPDTARVPLALFEGVLKVAFKLAQQACAADADAASDRHHFYQAISRDVLRAFAKAQPRGKSTFEVLRVAHRLGVPCLPLPGGAVQLGWGAQSRRIDRSTTDQDSALGMCWARNKLVTAELLRQAGLPSAVHTRVESPEQARQAAERIGYPVVVKPADLERGEGVSVDVQPDHLEAAFGLAHQRSPGKAVLVEQQVEGVCHRLFVAAGRLLYAVKRMPIGVYADGRSTIRTLVGAECALQHRLPPWKRSGIRPLDEMALDMLHRQGWGPDSVPKRGVFVALRRIETTAWGGVDEEVTHTIHPDNVSAAITAAQLFGLEVAGVDMISSDIRKPWHANGAIINEVNYAPLLGGGEISRQYIEEYLNRILQDKGRIPLHLHAGGDDARARARQQWDELRASGLHAYLIDGQETLDPSGNAVALRTADPQASLQALLMRKNVEAVIAFCSSRASWEQVPAKWGLAPAMRR